MKIAFKQIAFNPARRALIEKADEVLEREWAKSFPLTLRGLHYQFVANDLYPADWAREVEDKESGAKVWTTNNQLAYDKLGELVNDGRLCGMIDWESMEDETRGANTVAHWENPGSIIATAASSYKVNMWKGQPTMCEVWVEKDARKNVIGKAASSLYVPHFSCRGFPSQTAMYDAAQRVKCYLRVHDEVRIYYSGDHDPSGLAIPEDIQNRFNIFLGDDAHRLTVERVALNMQQVRKYKPIDNFAKLSDGRAKKYVEKYGNKSWELDALDSELLYDIVRESVLAVRDADKYAEAEAKLAEDKKLMTLCKDNWQAVADMLGDRPAGANSSYPPVALHAAMRGYKDTASMADYRGMFNELAGFIAALENGERNLGSEYYDNSATYTDDYDDNEEASDYYERGYGSDDDDE